MSDTNLSKASHGGIPAITGKIDYNNAIHIFPEALAPWRSTVLSYGSSFVATTIGFPMDTVKTRMQTHPEFHSYFDCAAKTFKAEGIRGFFRGIFAPLVSSSFSKSINVSIFTQTKPYVHDFFFKDEIEETHPFIKNIPVCFASGMVAGAGVSLFACPFEFTKIFSQITKLIEKENTTELNRSYNARVKSASTMATFKKIIKYEGPLGLYSGFKYHVWRDSLSSGTYYCVYETMKYTMNVLINNNPQESSSISILLAGGLSGITCWSLIFPIDTTKSLVQKEIIRNILRKRDGLQPVPLANHRITISRQMYRGLGISCTRSFIVNMVFFSTFEFLMAHIA